MQKLFLLEPMLLIIRVTLIVDRNFFKAYQHMLAKGLKSGVEGKVIKIHAPLINKTKGQIIRMGLKLKVPYELTWSCYQGGRISCGKCDSCVLRKKGFDMLKMDDPL